MLLLKGTIHSPYLRVSPLSFLLPLKVSPGAQNLLTSTSQGLVTGSEPRLTGP